MNFNIFNGFQWVSIEKTMDFQDFGGRPGRVGDQPEKGNRALPNAVDLVSDRQTGVFK